MDARRRLVRAVHDHARRHGGERGPAGDPELAAPEARQPWNWIFFINVPAGLAALVLAPVLIEESRDTSAGQRLDLPGLATSGVGLFALTYGFIEANTYGWASAQIIGAFLVAAAALTAFITLERRERVPMLNLSLFRNRTFSGANTAMFFIGLAMLGTFLLPLALHAKRARLFARRSRRRLPAADAAA